MTGTDEDDSTNIVPHDKKAIEEKHIYVQQINKCHCRFSFSSDSRIKSKISSFLVVARVHSVFLTCQRQQLWAAYLQNSTFDSLSRLDSDLSVFCSQNSAAHSEIHSAEGSAPL